MGLVISLFICLLASIVGITIYETVIDTDPEGINITMAILISAGALVFSILLNLLINYRYYIDLRIREKVLLVKTLKSKSKKVDYAGGRGKGVPNAFINRYEFIVDDIAFRVDKDLFESCSEGDELFFSYAPKSQYLLCIEKSRSHYLK